MVRSEKMRLKTRGDYQIRIETVKEDLEIERGRLEYAEVEIMDAKSRRVAAEKDIKRLESEMRALESKLSALTE